MKGEKVGAESDPLAFIAVDGFGDITNQEPTGERQVSVLIIIDLNQPGITAAPLAILQPQVNGGVVPLAYRLHRGLRRRHRRGGSLRHREKKK